ncbi:hypothetical protein ABEX44_15955 [Priestia megaterium]
MEVSCMWLLLAGDWRARRKTAAGKAEQVSPQKRKRGGDSLGRPRKAKSCTEINSGVSSGPYELISPLCSSLNGIDLVMSQAHISFGLLPALSK